MLAWFILKKTINQVARQQSLCGVLKISNWWLVTTHHTHPSKRMVALSDLLGFIMHRPTFQRHRCISNTTSSKKSLVSTECQICRTCQNHACMVYPEKTINLVARKQILCGVLKISNWWLVTTHHTHPSKRMVALSDLLGFIMHRQAFDNHLLLLA